MGSVAEARAELKQIDAAFSLHPDVLRMHWLLYSAERHWELALEVAQELVQVDPTNPDGWLNKAYAVRRAPCGGLKKAWDALRPALEAFPEEPIIPYNLACYACQMRNFVEARACLRRAFAVGGKKTIKRMALNDGDLEPLWDEILKW